MDDPHEGTSLNERLLDVLVFAPAGLVLSVIEEFPKFANLGRERLGMKASSARVVGEFAVRMGREQLLRRAGELFDRGNAPFATDDGADDEDGEDRADGADVGRRSSADDGRGDVTRIRPVPSPARPHQVADEAGEPSDPVGPTRAVPPREPHVPDAASLGIPGFDTLSASQVVQRLDGLSREELVSVRSYEAGNRGRRTILSRVDQLLDERS